jgi:hypothetical protein
MTDKYELTKLALLDFGHELPKSTDVGSREENMRLHKEKYAYVIDEIFNQSKEESNQLLADRKTRLVQVLEDYLFELGWEDWENESELSVELLFKEYFNKFENIYSTASAVTV